MGWVPYIDLVGIESLLQIVIYSFIRDLTDQSKIRYSDLLLFCGIECGFLDIGFAAARCSGSSSTPLGLRCLLIFRTSTYPLLSSELAICSSWQGNRVMRLLTILNSSPGCRALLQDAPRTTMSVLGVQLNQLSCRVKQGKGVLYADISSRDRRCGRRVKEFSCLGLRVARG